jgi:hypothetical protein
LFLFSLPYSCIVDPGVGCVKDTGIIAGCPSRQPKRQIICSHTLGQTKTKNTMMMVRVRTNVGMWRVIDLHPALATTQSILEQISHQRPYVQYQTPLCFDVACTQPIHTVKTLSSQGITHGSMIYCQVDPTTTLDVTATTTTAAAATGERDSSSNATTDDVVMSELGNKLPQQSNSQSLYMKRVIDKDGSIRLIPTNEGPSGSVPDKGFRKGLMPLRDIKVNHFPLYFCFVSSSYIDIAQQFVSYFVLFFCSSAHYYL